MAKLIKTTGEVITVSPENKTDFSGLEINDYVGGHFEMVQLKEGAWMAVNDNGKLIGLEYNFAATQVAKERSKWPFNDFVAGDALVLEAGEVK